MPHYGGPEGSIVGGDDLLPGSEAAKIAHGVYQKLEVCICMHADVYHLKHKRVYNVSHR
jgi:hypothetical protein